MIGEGALNEDDRRLLRFMRPRRSGHRRGGRGGRGRDRRLWRGAGLRGRQLIALPDGPGTPDELIEPFVWRQFGLHQKPAKLLSLDGYRDSPFALVRKTLDRGFANAEFLAFSRSTRLSTRCWERFESASQKPPE
jgi:hypothetical protein